MEGFVPSVVWATGFTVLGALLGISGLLLGVYFVPRLVDRFTPHIDEEMEILKGNQAVATYFGWIVGCTIIGISLIISASIIAGIHG
ncbi:MAG: DUF350 domain-containing protein [Candidatus Riflebacteria bacterium]|nr:DUF350 domain-containing protein [Candidatus Riflebacteria bacterium]